MKKNGNGGSNNGNWFIKTKEDMKKKIKVIYKLKNVLQKSYNLRNFVNEIKKYENTENNILYFDNVDPIDSCIYATTRTYFYNISIIKKTSDKTKIPNHILQNMPKKNNYGNGGFMQINYWSINITELENHIHKLEKELLQASSEISSEIEISLKRFDKIENFISNYNGAVSVDNKWYLFGIDLLQTYDEKNLSKDLLQLKILKQLDKFQNLPKKEQIQLVLKTKMSVQALSKRKFWCFNNGKLASELRQIERLKFRILSTSL